MTEYKKLIDWSPKKGDRFVDKEGDVLICDTDETARWSMWDDKALSLPFAMFDRPNHKPIGTITETKVAGNPAPLDGCVGSDTPDDYAPLRAVLDAAYEQAASGKGKERHANDKPFDRQPLLEISRMVGVGGPAYQVMKKTQEAVGMLNRGQHAAARAEMLGAINYAAAMVMLIDD